jgi:hypothetical protein
MLRLSLPQLLQMMMKRKVNSESDIETPPAPKRRKTDIGEAISRAWVAHYFEDDDQYDEEKDSDFDPGVAVIEDEDGLGDENAGSCEDAPREDAPRSLNITPTRDESEKENLISNRMTQSDKPEFVPTEAEMFKPRRSTSTVWHVFAKVQGLNGWAFCRGCNSKNSWFRDHGSTTSLKKHVETAHGDLLRKESVSSPFSSDASPAEVQMISNFGIQIASQRVQ